MNDKASTVTVKSDSSATIQANQQKPVKPVNLLLTDSPVHLVLRIRDEKKELQDIKFDFLPTKDTVAEISNELVNAKLIDKLDMIVGETRSSCSLPCRLVLPSKSVIFSSSVVESE
jgi:hypothetical protein